MLFHVFALADILAAGADGEPAAVPADIGQHLGGGFGIDLPDEGLSQRSVPSLLGQQEQRVSVEKVSWIFVPGTSRSWWTTSFMCSTKASL